MNLVNLNNYEFELNNVLKFGDNDVIFCNTVSENGVFKRYFYRYSLIEKSIRKINKKGICSCENAYYVNKIIDGYIFTNAFNIKENLTQTLVYKINISNGEIERLYSIEKDVSVIFLDDNYIVIRGSNFDFEDIENSDIQNDVLGEYEFAILVDLGENQEYTIKDKRVVLGIRDYFVSYKYDDTGFILFEEAYMDDWELEDMFNKSIRKEQFFRKAYRESVNVIEINRFIECVKNECEIIDFKQLHKSELNAWTRYFGMDDEYIYYRSKEFISQEEVIVAVKKGDLSQKIIKTIYWQVDDSDKTWYDFESNRIYQIKIINNKIKQIKDVLNDNFTYEYEELKEDFEGKIDNYIITSYWTEDNDDFNTYVKVKNVEDNNVDIYEGVCIIVKENLLLFK